MCLIRIVIINENPTDIERKRGDEVGEEDTKCV